MNKKLAITGAILTTIMVVLIVLPIAFEGKIENLVKKTANKSMRAKLQFSKLNLSFIRNFPNATISLNDLVIVGIDQFSKDTLVSAQKASVTVDLMSIFNKKGYDVSQIILDKANISLKIDKNGAENWDITIPDTLQKMKSEPSNFKLKLRQINAYDSKFCFDDLQSNRKFSISKLEATCSGDMTADITNLKIDANAGELNFEMDKIPYMNKSVCIITGEIEADLKKQKYTFHKNQCRLNAIDAEIEGWFAMPAEGFDMDLKLKTPEMNFKQILSIVPGMYSQKFDEIKTEGKVTLDAWIKGHYQDSIMPKFNLSIDVKDANFKYPSLPKSVDDIQLNLKISNPGGKTDLTVVNLKNLQFKLGGNPFAMMALIKTPISNPDFTLAANGKIDLNMIKEVYPLEKGTELNGKLTANLNIKGNSKQLEREQYDQINAAGTLSLMKMKYKSKEYPEILINNMAMNFTPKYIELTNASLRFGKTDLTGNGRLENFIAYALNKKTLKGNLNIASNYININELMGSTTTSSTKDTSAMKAFEIPKNIDFVLQSNIKKIIYDKMILENATGKLTIKDGKIDFSNLKMNAFGGLMEAFGSYSTALNPKKPDINFALNISEASFSQTFQQLDMVKKLTPIFEKTVGNYSINFKMAGKLDNNLKPDLLSLVAQGILQSRNVSVKDVKAMDALAAAMKDDKFKTLNIKDLKLPFEIKDGKVNTKPFDVKLGDMNINLAGFTTLEQNIQYDGKITLPEGYSSKLGVNIRNVDFKLGGTFTQPKVTLDTKSMVKNIAKQAINQGLQKALGANNEAEIKAKMDAIRQEAQASANKIIEQADIQAQKVVDQASNPIAKFAAKKVAEQIKKEAQNKAQSIIDDAEKRAQTLKQ